MIRCKILVPGPYSDYQGSGTNRKAAVHSMGQIIQFPVPYAIKLEELDMVEILPELELNQPDVIEIDEEDQEPVVEPPSATEAASEFAADSRIDLADVVGSGTEGRITLADVRNYETSRNA